MFLPSTKGPDWPIACDIDGDGTDEVLTATSHAHQLNINFMGHTTPSAGIDLFHGKTGKSIWSDPVVIRNSDQQNNRIAITDDLDGDGQLDFMAASMHCVSRNRPEVYIDVFSGRQGERLRFKKLVLQTDQSVPNHESVRIERLSYRYQSGQPIASVVVSDHFDGVADRYSEVFEFNVLTGEMLTKTRGVQTVGNPSGGTSDIEILVQHDVPTLDREVSRFRVRDKSPGYRWRRLGFDLQVIGDVDKDGIKDFSRSKSCCNGDSK